MNLPLTEKEDTILKEILIELEHQRNRVKDRQDYPPSDYPYRVCQAIVASKMGFRHRAQWGNSEYLGFETRI